MESFLFGIMIALTPSAMLLTWLAWLAGAFNGQHEGIQ